MQGINAKEIMTVPSDFHASRPPCRSRSASPRRSHATILLTVRLWLTQPQPQTHTPILILTGDRKKPLILIKLGLKPGGLPKNDDSRIERLWVSPSPKPGDAAVRLSLRFHKALQAKEASCQSAGPRSLRHSTSLG